MYGFLRFVLLYDFVGLGQFLQVKSRPYPNGIFMVSMGYITLSKTVSLTGALHKKSFFFLWDFELIHDFVNLNQFLEVKFRPCPNRIFKLFVGLVAHSDSNTKRSTMRKCVFFAILQLFMTLWDIGIDRNTGSGRVEPP